MGSGRTTALSPPPTPLWALDGRAALGRLGVRGLCGPRLRARARGIPEGRGVVGPRGPHGTSLLTHTDTRRHTHRVTHRYRDTDTYTVTHTDTDTQRDTETDTQTHMLLRGGSPPAGGALHGGSASSWSPLPQLRPGGPEARWVLGMEGAGSSVRAVSTKPGRTVNECPPCLCGGHRTGRLGGPSSGTEAGGSGDRG